MHKFGSWMGTTALESNVHTSNIALSAFLFCCCLFCIHKRFKVLSALFLVSLPDIYLSDQHRPLRAILKLLSHRDPQNQSVNPAREDSEEKQGHQVQWQS